jgi:hypothetical protein
VKTTDLFAGCSVTITPHDDVWLVSLNTEDEHMVAMRTYHELSDALEAVNLWTLMLSDQTEINTDHEAHRRRADLMRETLARLVLGQETKLPEKLQKVVEQDELRTWFEREMGT